MTQLIRPHSRANYIFGLFNLKLIAQEAGQLKQIGEESGIVTQGEFSYTAPDGQQYKVTFVADENGFQPQVRIIIWLPLFMNFNLYNKLTTFLFITGRPFASCPICLNDLLMSYLLYQFHQKYNKK